MFTRFARVAPIIPSGSSRSAKLPWSNFYGFKKELSDRVIGEKVSKVVVQCNIMTCSFEIL